VVAYTEPEEGVIRIISAREATRREQTLFRDNLFPDNMDGSK